MKRPWIKLAIFLIPAIAATLFVLWRFSPEQAIIRRADAIFATIEKKTVSLSGGPKEAGQRLKGFLAPSFEVIASPPLPNGRVSPDAAADSLEQFHSYTTSCKISRDKPTVTFPGSGEAAFEAVVDVDVVVGRSSRRILRYQCRLEFEKSGRDWLLKAAVLKPL